MRISKKGEYGLKALIRLALNYEEGTSVTPINDIAKREGIPQKYLEQILLDLKKGGILVSKRGVGGGYALSRPPADISLGEAIRIVEGPLVPFGLARAGSQVDCDDESGCVLYSVMFEVENAISNMLDKISLKDMAKRTLDLIERKRSIHSYDI